MSVILYIKYGVEVKTKIYVFAFSIFSKSSLFGNSFVFKNININEMDRFKKNTQ